MFFSRAATSLTDARLHLIPAFLTLSLSMLSGCLPVAVGAAGAGGVVAVQERTLGEAVDDYTLWTKIKAKFAESGRKGLLTDVNLEVVEGRVYLTGSVPTPEGRPQAEQICWDTHGVKEVHNDLTVNDVSSLKDYASDKWIFTQIKSRLLLEKDLYSVNYSVEVVNGTVYVMGIAQSHDELRRVTEVVRMVKGVKQVISYARVKNSGAPS